MNHTIFNIDKTIPLTLKTTDISPVSSYAGITWDTIINNDVGIIKNYRTDLTFKNINLKELLGKFYDEYEYFNIELVQLITLFQPLGGDVLKNESLPKNTMLNVCMSGLDFVNSSYSQKDNNNKTYIQLDNISNQTKLLNGNFVLNNDFEYTAIENNSKAFYSDDSVILPNWTINGTLINKNPAGGGTGFVPSPLPSGSQCIYLQKYSGSNNGQNYAETIPYEFLAGQEYTISFYLASRSGGNVLEPVQVYLGNDLLIDWITPTYQWALYSYNFVPSVTSMKSIKFMINYGGADFSGLGIDLVTCSKKTDGSSMEGYNYNSSSYFNNNFMFRKSQQKVDLNIWFENTSGKITEDTITNANIFNHTTYKFNITPIKI